MLSVLLSFRFYIYFRVFVCYRSNNFGICENSCFWKKLYFELWITQITGAIRGIHKPRSQILWYFWHPPPLYFVNVLVPKLRVKLTKLPSTIDCRNYPRGLWMPQEQKTHHHTTPLGTFLADFLWYLPYCLPTIFNVQIMVQALI